MKEKPIEQLLKRQLEANGFLVLKLETPGYNGTPDRLILRPTWSPGAPWVVEVKRPGEKPRRQQELVAIEWIRRGVKVLPFVSTVEEVNSLSAYLYNICVRERLPEELREPS